MKAVLAAVRRWLAADLARIRIAEHDIAIKRVHLTTLRAAVAIATIVAFTGGLFTGHYIWKPTPQQIQRSCPPNNAQLGCVVKLYAQHAGVKAHDPSGPHFPDVSDWQGHPDWTAAKPSISGAIVKAYEYSQDPDFGYNATTLTRLGVRWGAYLFVRNCYQGGAFAQVVRPWAAHISVLVLDMEVPSAAGCAPSLYTAVHAALPHIRVAIYASPGAWPGGSNAGLDAWVAAYGPSSPPCLFTCHVGTSTGQTILAWQLTDGQYGFRVYVPGIGYGDVSLDYGIFDGATVAKPKPKPARVTCFGKHPTGTAKACAPIQSKVAGWQQAETATKHAITNARHGLKANDCRTPLRRDICVDLGRETLPVLRQRQKYYAGRVTAAVKAYS